ncbi:hypothetical protein M0802_002063 [Mischocyttarus mexicanus]|nr:hypothetical protein M0802_002063 [Mischocyttarus mexicanus]
MDIKMLFAVTVVFSMVSFIAALKEEECEVCIITVNKFAQTLTSDVKSDYKKNRIKVPKILVAIKMKIILLVCQCYYLGGLEESATGILGELSKPLSWSMPADKICEKLKKKDAQICDLRFEKQIDLSTVDLKKLKVRDLKKILNDWDELCEGCIEKTDFIKRIEELKPKYSSSSKSEL